MPFGSEVGVIVMVAVTVAFTVMLSACVAVSDVASAPFTVKLLVPVPDGVPEIVPVAAASPSPLGNVPEEIDQVYGCVPPLAASVVLYAVLCVALGKEVVVIEGPVVPMAILMASNSGWFGV